MAAVDMLNLSMSFSRSPVEHTYSGTYRWVVRAVHSHCASASYSGIVVVVIDSDYVSSLVAAVGDTDKGSPASEAGRILTVLNP